MRPVLDESNPQEDRTAQSGHGACLPIVGLKSQPGQGTEKSVRELIHDIVED